MLRIIQNSSAGGAKSYFGTSTADYYTEGHQELQGVWRGAGAARLGLTGKVDKSAWDALCDNRHPATGQTLTLRRKETRRVGYDMNFHVPKSMSVLYSMTKDERILNAFRDSVNETMRDIEAEIKARVRTAGSNEDRTTGNMVWGEFVHLTARPVNGIPDPHLHAHCFVFNSTFDAQEQRWKAGQFGDIKRDAPYFEAAFHVRMGKRLADLGLPVERTKTGWEIAGITPATLAKFSRRTALIEDKAREQGVTDAHEKAELGAKTRERKQKSLSFDELRILWKDQLAPEEWMNVEQAGAKIGGHALDESPHAARDAVDLAVEHCFERKSVLPERQVLAAALKQAVGQASVAAVTHAFEQRGLLQAERAGKRYVTTPGVLAEEQSMLRFAREGRGTCPALASTPHVFQRDWLNAGQRKAVEHVLGSRDRVTLVRGAAGTGKTSMMQETVEAIEAGGNKVFTFAPSAAASRGVLRNEGFKDAETVARLLADPALQQEIQGQVLWIDEAGLLGCHTTAQVFDLADKLDARVILSGDRRQHGSVERGAALRLLETEAGLIPAEIKEIMRQKGSYKQAVNALSEGRTEDGFDQLDKLGWIKEIDDAQRYKALATDYVAAIQEKKSALVVSPTHREGEAITDEIRSELRRAGKLGKEQRQFRMLENADLTVAQRRDPVNLTPGDVLVYHQNAQGHRRGQRVVVQAAAGGAGGADAKALPPLDQADKFQVFHANLLPLAAGDVIRITRNGQTADGHRLNNGTLYSVKGFTAKDDIELENGWVVGKDFGHIAYGYVVTSHASQGKTVDRVIIASSSHSSPAASREQFYVSVSRGREHATVYTDDKEALKEAVSQTDERLSATEVLGVRERRERHARLERQQERTPIVVGDGKADKHREGMTYER